MTIPETEAYRAAVIRFAPDWARGEHTIGCQEELGLIAYYYNVSLPAYMLHFCYSNGPEHVVATGAQKGILRTLKKLKAAINKKETSA